MILGSFLCVYVLKKNTMNEDLKKLLDHSVEYASELLVETGDSYPFAAYIDTIGNVHPLEMEIDTKNVPQIQKVIDALTIYCSEEMKEGRMRAYCLSYEVLIHLTEEETTDAIAFEMKHQTESGLPKYYLPFRSKRISKKEIEKNLEAGLPVTGNDEPLAELGELFAVK